MSEFNPAENNLVAVRDHLATADVEEVARVKALEAEAETPRKGVLDWAPNPAAVKPDEDGYSRVLVEDAYQPGEPVAREGVEA